MTSRISKTLIAALAFGAINALPQPKAITSRAEPTDNTDLIASILTAPTTIKGFRKILTNGQSLLSGDDLVKATVFDFNDNPAATIPIPGSQGGHTTSSNVETFPLLTNSGLSMNFATMGPCGLLAPHVHPRANEYFIVVDGEVDFGYKLEAGLLNPPAQNPEINGNLKKYQGTFFPQGSVHYQINNSKDCKPASIFASLSSEDAGATPFLLSNVVGNENGTVVPRQIEGNEIGGLRGLLPGNIVKIVDECVARCHIA